MVQIARGTTGQAGLADAYPSTNPVCALPHGIPYVIRVGDYAFISPFGEHIAGVYDGSPPFGGNYYGDADGIVSIDEDAPLGIFSFIIVVGTCLARVDVDENGNPTYGEGILVKLFEFQVVPDIYRPPGPGDPICKL